MHILIGVVVSSAGSCVIVTVVLVIIGARMLGMLADAAKDVLD